MGESDRPSANFKSVLQNRRGGQGRFQPQSHHPKARGHSGTQPLPSCLSAAAQLSLALTQAPRRKPLPPLSKPKGHRRAQKDRVHARCPQSRALSHCSPPNQQATIHPSKLKLRHLLQSLPDSIHTAPCEPSIRIYIIYSNGSSLTGEDLSPVFDREGPICISSGTRVGS